MEPDSWKKAMTTPQATAGRITQVPMHVMKSPATPGGSGGRPSGTTRASSCMQPPTIGSTTRNASTIAAVETWRHPSVAYEGRMAATTSGSADNLRWPSPGSRRRSRLARRAATVRGLRQRQRRLQASPARTSSQRGQGSCVARRLKRDRFAPVPIRNAVVDGATASWPGRPRAQGRVRGWLRSEEVVVESDKSDGGATPRDERVCTEGIPTGPVKRSTTFLWFTHGGRHSGGVCASHCSSGDADRVWRGRRATAGGHSTC